MRQKTETLVHMIPTSKGYRSTARRTKTVRPQLQESKRSKKEMSMKPNNLQTQQNGMKKTNKDMHGMRRLLVYDDTAVRGADPK